ncbi:MAG: outer membrane protein assembly factor BamA [Acidobacteriota bacterium]|nr:outer membrane protein assembly factor BamA [Acidobacteriota bacterium]
MRGSKSATGWLHAFAALTVLALGASLAAAAQAPSIEGEQVTAVRVVDAQGELLEQNPADLPLQAGKPYRTDIERSSLKQLFTTGLYADIRTIATPEAGGVRIDFTVVQNYFIGVTLVRGLREPPSEAQALAALNLQLGDTFTEDGLQAALKRLTETLDNNGLYQAKLLPERNRDPKTHLVAVTVVVSPGPRARFGEIHFVNHSPFNERELLERTKLKPGGRVTADRIRSGMDRLRQFLAKKNYLTARVDNERGQYDARKNTLPLTIRVDGGPQVRVVVEGAKVSGKQVKKLVPIYEEGAVDPDLLEEGRRNLHDYFERKGYFNSQVDYQTREDKERNQETIVYAVERGNKSRLVGVSFSGNRYFNSELLASRLAIQPASFLSPGRFSPRILESDVESIRGIYLASGFRDVSVKSRVEDDYQGNKNDLFVHFEIQEGPQSRVASLTIDGNHEISDEQLFGVIASTAGQPYSQANISNDRDNILALYYNSGFPQASFRYDARKEGPNRMALTYTIDEGPQVRVNRVIVLGYQHTRPGVIQRRVQIQPGQPLREADIVSTQDRLYNLGIFNRVDVATRDPSGSVQNKDVLIETREGDRYTIGYGGGVEMQRLGSTTSATSTTLEVSPLGIFNFSKLNVFGRAQTLSFKARASTIQYRGLLSYQIPSLLTNPKFNLLVTGFADKSQDVNTFSGTRYEGSVLIQHDYSRGTTFLYRYTYRHVLVDASSLRINPEQIPLYSQPTRISGFGFSWVRDRRDNPADATRGNVNTADISVYADSLGSSTSFARLFFQNSTYTHIGRVLVFARSTRFGVEEPFGSTTASNIPCPTTPSTQPCNTAVIPLPERFFAGGGTNLRGFGLNQAGPRDPTTGFPIGGLAELIFNQELRFPLRLPYLGNAVGGAVFYDAGNVYSQLNAINLNWKPPSPSDLNYFSHTIGFGLRYNTPVGPVRFDVGYLLNSAQFQLSCTVGTPGCPPSGIQFSSLPRFQFFFNIGSAF